MMAITHACIALAGTSLILNTAHPLPLGLAILGSQLPDIDTSTSLIGQICFPLSHWIEDRYPHRTITHSLLATIALTLLSLTTITLLGATWQLGLALPLGHLLACFADTFTKQGVMLFYPHPAWCISVSNPRRRLTTGGPSEYWVLSGAIALLFLGLVLATGGGITQQVGQAMGLKEAVVETYNKSASSRHIWAEVQGVWATDRSRADGKYFVVGLEGAEAILSDGRGLYKTGQQIIVERLTVSTGSPATVQVQTLSFNDEDLVPKLREVAIAYPNALLLVSGQVVVNAPENLKLPVIPGQLATAVLTGNTVAMNYHPLESAIAQLQEQYGMGTLSVKVVSPKP
jgi:inner membrane protein